MAAARDAIDQVMAGGESPPEEAEALEEGWMGDAWKNFKQFMVDPAGDKRKGAARRAAEAEKRAKWDADFKAKLDAADKAKWEEYARHRAEVESSPEYLAKKAEEARLKRLSNAADARWGSSIDRGPR